MKTRTHNIIISLSLLAMLTLIIQGCGPSLELEGAEGKTDVEVFEAGTRYYESGEYENALRHFLYVKNNYLRSTYAGVTRFYAGESYFELGEYDDASIEYQSFLSFFPHDPHAAEAQYKLGVSYLKQALSPDRDQTTLHQALTELQNVQTNYPEAQEYIQKAAEAIRRARHKLALHEYLVGMFYRTEKLYSSSNSRFTYLLQEFPESTLGGDASFLMGLNYLDLNQPEEATTSFFRVIQGYPNNQHVSEAQQRLAKLGVADIPQPVIQADSPPQAEPAPTPSQSPTPKLTTDSPPSIDGYVVLIRDNLIFTDLIRSDGIQEGMILDIRRAGNLVGTIRITEIQDGFSAGETVTLVPGETIKEEDTVCCPKTQ